MASPVLPSDFKAVIPDASASLCGNFTKALLQLPVLLYKLVNWLLDSSGNLSPAFNASISTTAMPTGAVIMAASQLTNANFLLCDGTTYQVSAYPTLGALLGSAYGGDGVTTFGVPDMRDRFVTGASSTKSIGSTGGSATATLAQSDLPNVKISLESDSSSGNWLDSGNRGTGSVDSTTTAGIDENVLSGKKIVQTKSINGDVTQTAVATVPPYRALHYYIRV